MWTELYWYWRAVLWDSSIPLLRRSSTFVGRSGRLVSRRRGTLQMTTASRRPGHCAVASKDGRAGGIIFHRGEF